MRILLLGKYGQVGWELHRAMLPLGEIKALDFPDVDFTRPESLRQVVRKSRPELIVNAAAYTAVDKAEEAHDAAMAINGRAPGVLAEEAARLQAGLIHYSTDYVFDGTKGEPYTEGDQPNPLNAYGRSKLEGERTIQAVGGAYLILRTSWVYSLTRDCFVTKVLRWARERESLRIAQDEIGSPTWCRMLAEATAFLLAKASDKPAAWLAERKGVYHLAGAGSASRFAWAQRIVDLDPRSSEQVVQHLVPARSAEFPAPAARPRFTALDCARFEDVFGLRLPAWDVALRCAMESPGIPQGE